MAIRVERTLHIVLLSVNTSGYYVLTTLIAHFIYDFVADGLKSKKKHREKKNYHKKGIFPFTI